MSSAPDPRAAGEAISQRLCSVFTVGADARIAEYLDYG
jgi:hypothetical protein